MARKLESTPLFKRLKRLNLDLAARVVMVREEVAKWLKEIVTLFPHYPSHDVDHSDRIIIQLSKMLFRGNTPVVAFSDSELYCLSCAAYLHDMGMVASPGELTEILASDSWRKFVAEGGKGHDSFEKYIEIKAKGAADAAERTDFLAGLVLRQVLADFVRRGHHERSRVALEMHPFLKRLVDHGDPVAFETISHICIGHGLSDADLADTSRFPEERDVLDEKVNVRFLTRLLRIGDLLDMDPRRADPMTAGAVAPLPLDAVPHWRQYYNKKHEDISPGAIAFRFECQEQETHRILRDWFGWLESEVRATGLDQQHSSRHSKWKMPQCLVSSRANPNGSDKKSKPTIIVQPAEGAKYTFHDWKLEIDHELILERLVYDVYDDPSVFIRELIQNALDATRCQMYHDFAIQKPDAPLPERPTQFPKEFRDRYSVTLSLKGEEVASSPDAPSEKHTVFTIEDRGVGMDENVITRYFLQIGRSYYTSNEFREKYKFIPTSRFGVGFLSVFAVSNDITVETAKRNESTGKVDGIRLKLREPRNFLLTEPWDPFPERTKNTKAGTRICLRLNRWNGESILDLVRNWCVAVEVPVIVCQGHDKTVISPSRMADKTVLAQSKVDPNGRFILRVFDLDAQGVEGQVAVVAYEDQYGEGWCDCWPQTKGLHGAREDEQPEYKGAFAALHGVRFGGLLRRLRDSSDKGQWVQRVDIRSTIPKVTMDRSVSTDCKLNRRQQIYGDNGDGVLDCAANAVKEFTQHVVAEHLAQSQRAKGEKGAYYIGSVLSAAPVLDGWRDRYPGTVVTWQNGRREDKSVEECLSLTEFVLAAWYVPQYPWRPQWPKKAQHPRNVQLPLPIISTLDLPDFVGKRLLLKLRNMNLCGVETHDNLWLLTFSESRRVKGYERAPNCKETASEGTASWIAPGEVLNMISIELDILKYDSIMVMSGCDAIVEWLNRIWSVATSQPRVIDPASAQACWRVAKNQPWKLEELMRTWVTDARVPTALKPPLGKDGEVLSFRTLKLARRHTLW